MKLFSKLYHIQGKIIRSRELRDSVLSTFKNIGDVQIAGIRIFSLHELLDTGKEKEALDVIRDIENKFHFSMDSLAASLKRMNSGSSTNSPTVNIDNLRIYIGLNLYLHESYQSEHKKEIKLFYDWTKKLLSVYGVGVAGMAGELSILEAKCEVLNNNYDNAITILEENKIKSRELGYFLTLGRYYHHQKKYAKAEENFNIMIKRSPINPKAHYYAALLYYDWGETEKAKEYLNKSLGVWKNADEDYMYSNMAKTTAQEWNIEILN